MSISSTSSIGLQLQSLANLDAQQTNLANLNTELATGTQHDNLTDYAPTVAKNLMDFQNAVTQKQAYISGMQTVSTRLTVYDSTMTDMESITSAAQSLASSNQTLDSTTVSQLQTQAQTYLKEMTDDLNQQIGGRYIYSGSRYTTAPVTDLSASTTAPTIPFTATTSPNLPTYDTDYTGAGSTSAAAFQEDSVSVNTSFSTTYGVTSNNPAIQQIVAGLQFLNAATQPGVDAATYKTDMAQANSVLSAALPAIQAVHANVAANINLVASETSSQNSDITELQNQMTGLQQVDLTQVATELNVLQTQLQASYSATGSLEQLSILKYL